MNVDYIALTRQHIISMNATTVCIRLCMSVTTELFVFDRKSWKFRHKKISEYMDWHIYYYNAYWKRVGKYRRTLKLINHKEPFAESHTRIQSFRKKKFCGNFLIYSSENYWFFKLNIFHVVFSPCALVKI